MTEAGPAGADGRQLLYLWTRIGLQSFGGGQAVQLLAYEELVDKRRWLRPEEWAEAWGVCQMVPGVNVVAVAALTGSRLAGWWGVAGAVSGLMVPSVIITLLMTLAFNLIRDVHWVRAALQGIVFAAAGGSVMIGYRLIRPILAASGAESAWLLWFGGLVVLTASLLALSGVVPLIAVLLGAGAVAAVLSGFVRRPQEPPA
ncbi:MAG TPA: chromate transporter [Thermomicrobiaceae bacterium]|nr:chromate transporter [Thermomicrobiaceae bacterium]